MTDYYPLIARAVSSLDNNTGDMRRVVYERARLALVNQLRSFQPPLSESDITRELAVLEEAIQNIELETTKHSRSGDANETWDRPPHDEPHVANARNSAREPSAPFKNDEHHAFVPPVRSYDLLIKTVSLLLISGIAGAAYLQRGTLNSLLGDNFADSGMNIGDFAMPIVAFAGVVFMFIYWLLGGSAGFAPGHALPGSARPIIDVWNAPRIRSERTALMLTAKAAC